VEPRSPSEFATFLARWQHVTKPLKDPEGLRDVLLQLAGLSLPAAIWEENVLPLRVEGFKPSSLDRIIGGGEVCWQARGTGEGRRLAFLIPGQNVSGADQRLPVAGVAAEKIRETLQTRGALFFNPLVQAAGLGFFEALDGLKALMENGEITNDTLEPMRRFPQQDRKNRGRLMGNGALAGMGRWSLVSAEEEPAPEEWAECVLRRYGVVTPNLAAAEGLRWSEVMPIYEKWEMVGKLRRGYFVEGLGGMQYALAEAVEELRRKPGDDEGNYWVLHWHDPANPYRSLLEMPPSFGDFRIQPELIGFYQGRPVMIAGGKRLRIAAIADECSYADILQAFAAFCGKTRWNQGHIIVTAFNGHPILETEAAEYLAAAGFERGYRQMAWREKL
jgi:ATP-dependent Lhr-like helicase